MPLYIAKRTLNQNDSAAAGAAAAPLIDDIRQRYQQAVSPESVQQQELVQPSWQLPSLDSLGVTGAGVGSAVSSAIGALPGMGQRPQQPASSGPTTASWALPSLESLGVTTKNPGYTQDASRRESDTLAPAADSAGSPPVNVDGIPPEGLPSASSSPPALPASGTPSAMPTGQPSNGSNPEQQAAAYQEARASGLDDEGARVLVAVTETEGGLTGAIGDQGQSRGGYQFHEGGQMPGFRAWLTKQGIQGDPNTLVNDIRLTTRYAATGYLRQAIEAGRAQGLHGADLATYVQRHGQVSESPERTGANYARLFGGAPALTAGVSSPAESPPLSPPTGGSSGPSAAAAGSGAPDKQITVRNKKTGLTSVVSASLWPDMTNKADFEVVSGQSDMLRQSLSDPSATWSPDSGTQQPASFSAPTGRAGGGGVQSVMRAEQPADEPLPPGGAPSAYTTPPDALPYRRQPDPLIESGAAAAMPTIPTVGGRIVEPVDENWTMPNELRPLPQPARNSVPYVDTSGNRNRAVRGGFAEWTGNPNYPPDGPLSPDDGPTVFGTQYRQPLSQPTMGPDTTAGDQQPYDSRDADQGAHEWTSNPTDVPWRMPSDLTPTTPSFTEPSSLIPPSPIASPSPADPTLAQDTASITSSTTRTGTASGPSWPSPSPLPPTTDAPTYGPPLSEAGPAPAESPLKPVWDAAGNIVGAIHTGLGAAGQAVQGAADQIGANMAGNRQAVTDANAGRSGGVDFGTGAQRAVAGAPDAAIQAAQDAYADPFWQAVPAPARAAYIVSQTAQAFGSEVGRNTATALGIPDTEVVNILGHPVTSQDIAGFVGGAVFDPTTYITGPEPVAHFVGEGVKRVAGPLLSRGVEAARGLGTRVTEGISANAEHVAAADARMAREGSTTSAGTLGQSWDDFSRSLDSDAQRAARERASQPTPRPTNDQLIREEYGRPWQEVAPDPATRAMQEESGSIARPRNQVSPSDAANLTPPVQVSPNMEGRMNATLGQSLPSRAGLGTRLAADIGSSAGSGVMGAAIGAGAPADTPEERRRNALVGAGLGMVAGPAASRLMRRGEGGALSTFGMSPGEGAIRRSPPTVEGQPMPPGQRALPSGRGRTADDLIVAAHNAVGVPEKASLMEPGRLERWRQSFVRAWTDNRVDLAELQNDARRILGRPLTGEEMVYEASRVNPSGAAKVAIDEHVRPILTGLDSAKPVVSIVDSTGRTASLTETQVLSRMMELVNNRDIATAMGNPARRFPGGLTGAESEQAARALLEKLPRESQVRIGQAANAISDTVDLYREKLVDAGVWTRQLGDQLKEQYPYWTPTKILDYMRDANNPGSSTIRSISLNDRHLRQYSLAGTDKMREDGVASLIRYIQQAEEDIAKNRTFTSFANLRENVPGWSDLVREVKTTTPVESLKGEKAVTGFVEGERKRFIVPAPMAAAIQMEGAQHIPFVADVSRLFRELITRTPFFVAGQVPLDAASMIIREVSREGGPTPQNIARVTGALIGGYREAFRGLTDGTFHGDTAAYLRQGGGMAGYYQRSAQAASRALDDVSRRSMLQIRNQDDLGKTLKWLALQGPTQAVGERVELAPRTASYRLGLNREIRRGGEAAAASQALVPSEQAGAGLAAAPSVRGVDERKANLTAMTGARDVTLDFQRGGNWAMVMNQAVPFSNVGIQSSVTPWRSFREKPAAYASTVVGLIGAPMLAAEAWNRADPQRARDYEDVPDYVKDRGIVIMTGQDWTDKQGNRHPYYALWQTRELSPFVIFGRELAGRTLEAAGVGGQTDHRTWGSLVEGAVSAASPIQANSAADAFSSATPLGASTGLQLATNQDFFRNKAIATDRGDQEAGVISQGIAKATGARPSQVEFGLRDMTGNVGAAILAGADLGASLLNAVPQGAAPKSLERTPVIGSVASRFEGSAIGNRLQRAQDQMMTPALRDALKQANMREDQATPVSNRYQNAQLRVDEQERWQRALNAEIPLALAKARSSSEWANPGTRRGAIQQALADAKDAAVKKALPGLTEGELNQRVIREHQGAGR